MGTCRSASGSLPSQWPLPAQVHIPYLCVLNATGRARGCFEFKQLPWHVAYRYYCSNSCDSHGPGINPGFQKKYLEKREGSTGIGCVATIAVF